MLNDFLKSFLKTYIGRFLNDVVTLTKKRKNLRKFYLLKKEKPTSFEKKSMSM